MQMTIDVPDTLPQERIKQRIQELEQSLINEATFFSFFAQKQTIIDDPWTNPESPLPCVDTGIEDFSIHHDHYLYGIEK